MNKQNYNIAVTGVGGNVGQGIIRNIRASTLLNATITGLDISRQNTGTHLCDTVIEVPFATDESYIPTISKIIEKEHIQLLIPSTDYEATILSRHLSDIPCTVPVSDYETCSIFFDKYMTWSELSNHAIPFAESVLVSEFDSTFPEYILKPRTGRGSRELYSNPNNLEQFDDSYLIQKLYKGTEITTAFYVTRSGSLHGSITLERELINGATGLCQVSTQYDQQISKILTKLLQHFPIRGSANIQSIVTDTGQIIPFEVNCRISGTNSIRSQFGFKDVEYTLLEYLLDKPLPPVTITPGCATRILMDVIYHDHTLSEDLTKETVSYLF